MQPLQSASIGREQEEHWDPGWSSGHIQRQAWVSRNRHLGAGWRSRSPVALHVCVSTGAPWHRRPGHCPPFHAPLPPATSTDCPCPMGGMAIPRPIDGHCASSVALPHIAPSPPSVLWHFRCATAHYVDRSPGTASGTGRRSPPPLRAHTGDPTLIIPVKGTQAKSSLESQRASCECIVNRQQIDHENSISGYTFSKPVTGWKPVNRLTGVRLNKLTAWHAKWQ